jgi:hypothetical protein
MVSKYNLGARVHQRLLKLAFAVDSSHFPCCLDRYPLTVTQAMFERKPGFVPKPRQQRRKLTPDEQAIKIRALEQRASLSWTEEGDESTGLRIIVLTNVFDPDEIAGMLCFITRALFNALALIPLRYAGDVAMQDELTDDVAAEVEKVCV